jgi:hypothetical protein
MKNATLVALLALGVTSTVSAQSTITQANIPVIGDEVPIAICEGMVMPGNAGADQIWDMSTLVEKEQRSFTYVAPASTPWGDDFPAATICGVSWDNSYSFYEVTSSALSVVGQTIVPTPGDTTRIEFDNLEQIIAIPYTYQTKFLDEFDGTFYTQGFEVDFEGSLDFEADGYGTLILPTGTYENVVRYHFFREQTNGGLSTQTKHQWAWVSPDYRFWLLLMETVDDGFNETHLIWYDKAPISANVPVEEATWSRLKGLYH